MPKFWLQKKQQEQAKKPEIKKDEQPKEQAKEKKS